MKFPAPPSEILQKECTHIEISTYLNRDVEVCKQQHKTQYEPQVAAVRCHGVACRDSEITSNWLHNKIQISSHYYHHLQEYSGQLSVCGWMHRVIQGQEQIRTVATLKDMVNGRNETIIQAHYESPRFAV